MGGAAGFLVLYGAVVGLDVWQLGGPHRVTRDRFAAYFGGGVAFAALAWYQPAFATLLVGGVLLIKLLNVLPELMDFFGSKVVEPLGSAAGVGSSVPTPRYSVPPATYGAPVPV